MANGLLILKGHWVMADPRADHTESAGLSNDYHSLLVIQDVPELPEADESMPAPEDVARELSIIHKICSSHMKNLQAKSASQVGSTALFLMYHSRSM